MLPSISKYFSVAFVFSKEEITKSKCPQSDRSLTFCCKIFTHVIKEPTSSSSADPWGDAINCRQQCQLSTHLLWIIQQHAVHWRHFIVRGREFPAHRLILMDELKNECEHYWVLHMSSDICVVLLLHGDFLNPAEPLMEAAKIPPVFSTWSHGDDGWKKMKQENLVLLCKIQQFVLCKK